MALPVVALIGCPNVGKSTLFNQLTKTRDALVMDLPGTTRDRKYGEGLIEERPYLLIDTGGLGGVGPHGMDALTEAQSRLAIQEADVLLFVVDGQLGLTASDEAIANELRKTSKPILLVVNKTDGVREDGALADFYGVGFGEPIGISAKRGRGLKSLMEKVASRFPTAGEGPEENGDLNFLAEEAGPSSPSRIILSIVGRPNVGKSTLVNRMLGEERVVVFDKPGTTRDSIYVPFEREGQAYTLVDTAGVRRKSRVKEVVEKFSVVKTLQAIEVCHVAIVVVDAKEGLSDQDLHLLEFVLEAGKGLILAINKWDGLDTEQRQTVKKQLEYRLQFAPFVEQRTISALHGTGVGHLFDAAKKVYESATREISASVLTRVLEKAVTTHVPPLVRGRRIKLRYAHSGGQNPQTVVIHGNQTEEVPLSYRRYLAHAFRKALKLVGVPVVLKFKTGENPFKDKRNELTLSQRKKRIRLKKFVQKKDNKKKR